MKKIVYILFAGILSATSFASQLIVENNLSQSNARILHMHVTLENNYYNYTAPYSDPDYFLIPPLSVFEINDYLALNRQFPFHDVFPFSGNVSYNGGIPATLPLPSTADNALPPTTRFQFGSMRFMLDGAWANGVNAYDYMTNSYSEDMSQTFTYNLLPGNPTYEVVYLRISSFYYIGFND